MPIDYKRYPPNWFTEIRPAVMRRSDGKCEMCGVPNYAVGYRNADGAFCPTGGNIVHDLAGNGLSYPSLQPITYKEARDLADTNNEFRDGELRKHIVIVLTVAHLDHNVENSDLANLKALYQRCHLHLDKERHRAKAAETRAKKKNQQSLFENATTKSF